MNETRRPTFPASDIDGRDAKKKKPAKADKGKLDDTVQRAIGQQLKAMYSDVVSEGVPDRFADLISRLDKSN